jgi:hypothetical protein
MGPLFVIEKKLPERDARKPLLMRSASPEGGANDYFVISMKAMHMKKGCHTMTAPSLVGFDISGDTEKFFFAVAWHWGGSFS